MFNSRYVDEWLDKWIIVLTSIFDIHVLPRSSFITSLFINNNKIVGSTNEIHKGMHQLILRKFFFLIDTRDQGTLVPKHNHIRKLVANGHVSERETIQQKCVHNETIVVHYCPISLVLLIETYPCPWKDPSRHWLYFFHF